MSSFLKLDNRQLDSNPQQIVDRSAIESSSTLRQPNFLISCPLSHALEYSVPCGGDSSRVSSTTDIFGMFGTALSVAASVSASCNCSDLSGGDASKGREMKDAGAECRDTWSARYTGQWSR
jgi:hypothetical protein